MNSQVTFRVMLQKGKGRKKNNLQLEAEEQTLIKFELTNKIRTRYEQDTVAKINHTVIMEYGIRSTE